MIVQGDITVSLLINKFIIFAFFSTSLFFVGSAMAVCVPKDNNSTMTEFCEAGDTEKSCEDLDVCEWDDS